jgi:uncharacterized membrane protein
MSGAARIAGFVLASVAYVFGCHWLMTQAGDSPWNVVGVLSPMLLAVAVGAWRSGQRWLGFVSGLAVVALCAQALVGVRVPQNMLYLAQHVGINALLAFAFGSTLRAGKTALITTMAARVHRQLTPDMVVYTRKITGVWTTYFVTMVVVSLALFMWAPFEAWALFANLFTPVAVVLMFVIEYLLRYRLHPEFERVSVADAIRSYMHRDS